MFWLIELVALILITITKRVSFIHDTLFVEPRIYILHFSVVLIFIVLIFERFIIFIRGQYRLYKSIGLSDGRSFFIFIKHNKILFVCMLPALVFVANTNNIFFDLLLGLSDALLITSVLLIYYYLLRHLPKLFRIIIPRSAKSLRKMTARKSDISLPKKRAVSLKELFFILQNPFSFLSYLLYCALFVLVIFLLSKEKNNYLFSMSILLFIFANVSELLIKTRCKYRNWFRTLGINFSHYIKDTFIVNGILFFPVLLFTIIIGLLEGQDPLTIACVTVIALVSLIYQNIFYIRITFVIEEYTKPVEVLLVLINNVLFYVPIVNLIVLFLNYKKAREEWNYNVGN